MGGGGNECPSVQAELSHEQRQFFHSREEMPMYNVYGTDADRWVGVGKLVVFLDNFYFVREIES